MYRNKKSKLRASPVCCRRFPDYCGWILWDPPDFGSLLLTVGNCGIKPHPLYSQTFHFINTHSGNFYFILFLKFCLFLTSTSFTKFHLKTWNYHLNKNLLPVALKCSCDSNPLHMKVNLTPDQGQNMCREKALKRVSNLKRCGCCHLVDKHDSW